MRKLIIIIISVSFCLAIKAQDTIVKRTGDKLVVKLVEINATDIKYKRLDLLDGPLFSLAKQEISYVIYSNGTKDSFQAYVPPPAKPEFFVQDLSIQQSGKYFYYKERKLPERDMLAVVKKQNDLKLNLMVKAVERDRFIQNMTSDASVTLGVIGTYLYVKNQPRRGGGRRGGYTGQSATQVQGQKNGEYLMLGAIACELASVYFIFDRKKNDRILVGAYNQLIAIH